MVSEVSQTRQLARANLQHPGNPGTGDRTSRKPPSKPSFITASHSSISAIRFVGYAGILSRA